MLSGAARSSNLTSDTSIETTPLLSSGGVTPRYDGGDRSPLLDGRDDDADDAAAAASIRSRHSEASSIRPAKKSSLRWPSIIAMVFLAFFSVGIIVVAFFVPAAVEEYAKESAVLEPTNLSLVSITTNGVRARIQANFRLDGSRVKNEHVRRIGRVATWVVRELGTDSTKVNVYLPEFDNILLGAAEVPPLVISVIDGRTTVVDFVADLVPGDAEGIRTIANEWLEGRLDKLRVQGKADIQLKSGLVPLGTHAVSESFVFEGQYLYRSFASLYFGEKTLL